MSASSLFNELALVLRRTLSPIRKQECSVEKTQQQDVGISCPSTTSHQQQEIQLVENQAETTPLTDDHNTGYAFTQFGEIIRKKFSTPTIDVSIKKDGATIAQKTCFDNEYGFKAKNDSPLGDKEGFSDEEEVLTCTVFQDFDGEIQQNRVLEHFSALHYLTTYCNISYLCRRNTFGALDHMTAAMLYKYLGQCCSPYAGLDNV